MRAVSMMIVAAMVVLGVAGSEGRVLDGSSSLTASPAGDHGYGDDSAWGVEGPLDHLVDDLDLESRYPDQFSGGEVFYDRNVFQVGWKGDIPDELIEVLNERGQRDWVRFVPVRYSEGELLRAANALMDQLEAAGIETNTASSFDDSSAGWVTYYNKPWGARFRAERIALKVSSEVCVPVRAIATLEPLAVAGVG